MQILIALLVMRCMIFNFGPGNLRKKGEPEQKGSTKNAKLTSTPSDEPCPLKRRWAPNGSEQCECTSKP